jgi:transposase-like protein
MRREKRHFDLEYKKRIVAEFLTGDLKAKEIAQREGITVAFIYRWKIQLENREAMERISGLQQEEGYSPAQARKVRELEEEIEAYQKKVAELTLQNDLLKKVVPSFQSEKRSSGYIEIRNALGRSPRRVK